MTPSSPLQIMIVPRWQYLSPVKKWLVLKTWLFSSSSMSSLNLEYPQKSSAIEILNLCHISWRNFANSWESHRTSLQLSTHELMDNQRAKINGLNNISASGLTKGRTTGVITFLSQNMHITPGIMKPPNRHHIKYLWGTLHLLNGMPEHLPWAHK